MLKKRILASSMASVMALSAVSVVAFADETATAIKTEAVTKAELKEYIASLEKFVENELDDYGTTMSENFENAYEAAKVVVDDEEASSDDVTAAYQMLKAVKASLKMYTNTELKELVASYKKTYETENVMNEEFNDYIYSDDSWSEFESAYETADDSIDETDQRVINDAYADLEAAVKGLKANDKVTKSQFRAAYTQYIELVNSFKNYEDWRRGKATVGGNKVVFTGDTPANANKEKDFKGKELNFFELKDIVYGDSDTLPLSMDDDGYGDNVTPTAKNKNKNWITLGGIDGATNVRDDVENAYKKFVENSNSNTTTLDGIVKSYKAMKSAVAIFEGWEVDSVKRGSKTSIESLLDDYHNDIVKGEIAQATLAGETSAYDAVATAIENALTTGANAPAPAATVDVVTIAGKEKVVVGGTVPEGTTIKLDPDTGYIKTKYNAGAWTLDYANGTKTVKIKSGDDITKYMPINTTLIDDTLDAIDTRLPFDFSEVYEAFEACVANDALDADQRDYDLAVGPNIDSNNIVSETSTKSVAYPLVYRAMYYALGDMFPVDDTYTKKQVSDLIKKANDLIEATGDAAKFKTNNKALDKERKAAIAWVAAANATKGYEDGDPVAVDAESYDDYDGYNATQAYEDLYAAYDKLNKEFAKFPVSFGEIADTIAEVAAGIDAGIYGASTDLIKTALAEVSYDLSTLEWTDDCEAFDEDRNFIFYNRLKTDGTDGEKAFYKKYQALLTAVEDAKKEPEKPEVVKGDLDGDGKYSPADARAALELFLAGEYNEAADMDGNGIVNAKDARAILELWLQA